MRNPTLPAAAALFAAVLALAPASPRAQDSASAEGRWRTVDDKTGRAKAIVRIRREGGALSGSIERLFRLPDEIQDPVCIACEGERKGKRIVGMDILWGLIPAGGGWDGGSILDPENGKIYRCKLSVSPDGKALTVRGYLGISMLGRSQTWIRVVGDGTAPEGDPGGPAGH